jgi:hypothetical protein
MGGYASEIGNNTNQLIAIKGGFGSGTIGYNWQFNQIVAGVEADGAYANVGDSILVALLFLRCLLLHSRARLTRYRPCGVVSASPSVRSCFMAPAA